MLKIGLYTWLILLVKPVAVFNAPTHENFIQDDNITQFEIKYDINGKAVGALVNINNPMPGYTLHVAEKAVIFLDELSAADPSTQNAALQLCLDRRVNEYDVPFGVPILAAGNREDDGAFVSTILCTTGKTDLLTSPWFRTLLTSLNGQSTIVCIHKWLDIILGRKITTHYSISILLCWSVVTVDSLHHDHGQNLVNN